MTLAGVKPATSSRVAWGQSDERATPIDESVVVLGRNFRSRAEILEAAVRCVSHNQRRAPKALIAMRGPGGRMRVRAFANESPRRTG